MSDATYPPRTVAFVALGSLVAGFLVIFAGGMLLLRPRTQESATTSGAALPEPPPVPAAGADAASVADDAAATGTLSDPIAQGGAQEPGGAETTPTVTAPTPAAGSVTLGAAAISRCFDAGPPTPIASAQCGAVASLDAHLASKSAAIAQCARGGHGRLALVLDYRFSTSFVRGWGGPASTIGRAGDVTACVKQAVLPLPFSTMAHDHDRYLVVVPIDF